MILKKLNMICSAHHSRGNQVDHFNLSPYYIDKLITRHMTYRDRVIPLRSYGWVKAKGIYMLEVHGPEGLCIVNDFTYKLVEHDQSI